MKINPLSALKTDVLSLSQFLILSPEARRTIRLLHCSIATSAGFRLYTDFISRLRTLDCDLPAVVICDLGVQSESMLKTHLEVGSLLGPRLIVVLARREPGTIDQTLLDYLYKYQGSDMVWICSTNEPRATLNNVSKATVTDEAGTSSPGSSLPLVWVRIEDQVAAPTFEQLCMVMAGGCDLPFARLLYKRRATLALDEALVLAQYQILVGKNAQQFVDQWLDRLVEQKHSLFTLSEYLLARDATRFYRLWQEIDHLYVREFWVVYWSEQIFQAITFVGIAAQEGAAVARKSVTRLPFSFMNNDWRLWSVTQLAKLHEQLYATDYQAKHGGIIEGLDLFYAMMLHQK